MSKIEIELNSAGIRELLRSQEIMDELQSAADGIRAKLGDKFETEQFVGAGRANVSVYTTDAAAIEDNKQTNAMLKAMGIKTPSNTPRTGKKSKGTGAKGKTGRKSG